jgi:hypothetical protein
LSLIEIIQFNKGDCARLPAPQTPLPYDHSHPTLTTHHHHHQLSNTSSLINHQHDLRLKLSHSCVISAKQECRHHQRNQSNLAKKKRSFDIEPEVQSAPEAASVEAKVERPKIRVVSSYLKAFSIKLLCLF